jgi:ribosomal protein S12 methylthiotransferase
VPDTIRLYLHTLGCSKNDSDSHRLERTLRFHGIPLVEQPEKATHLLINTCGFTQEAAEESIAAVLGAAAEFPDQELLVMGCLVERYRTDLEKGIPEVSAWYGLGDGVRLVEDLRAGMAPVTILGSSPPSPALVSTSVYGYVKISDGCDHRCTYCTIPTIKGPYSPLPLGDIEEQARSYLEQGACELVLVGQDTAGWSDGPVGLAGLIERLAADPRLAWIRLMYLQPENVDDDLLALIAQHPKVCHYLDLPFQHASERVLARMGRQGDGDSYLGILRAASRLMPDVSVRTTFIVGFPGETEDDFETLLDFCDAAGFDHAGAFIFSPEAGTRAERLRPRVPRVVALERFNRLNDAIRETAEAANLARIGDRMHVLLESVTQEEDWPEGVSAAGRTFRQAPEVDGRTFVEGRIPSHVAAGYLLPVTVTGASGFDVFAEPRADA